MPRIGDGTGNQTGSIPTVEADTHLGGDSPEKPSGVYKESTNSQHPAHDGPHRTTPAYGGRK